MVEQTLLSTDNGVSKEVPADASLIAKEYYTSYAKYVLEYRALPSVYDGLKPVQRRVIYTANQFPKRLMKTAKLSGAVLQYHPHGSSSITGAINNMAFPLGRLPLFEIKGNFGGANCEASADRYTECYLSEMSRANFCSFIDYADYELGEIGEREPSAMPTLIPYCLVAGADGIGIGLSTKVMPLNLLDLIDYYIDYIKHEGKSKKLIKPDFGYVMLEMTDEEIRDAVFNSKGKVNVSSVITQISSNTFLVEEVFDRTIDTVINKLDKQYGWFRDKKVIFRDATTSFAKYVFEVVDKSISPEKFKEALQDATRRSGTYTRVVEEDGNAVYASLEYVVQKSLEFLNITIDRMIASQLDSLQKQLDLYTALNICKDKKVFRNASSMTAEKLIDLIIKTSGCTLVIAQDIIKKPISYLTQSHDAESQRLKDALDELRNHDRKKFLIALYKDFRKLVLPIYESRKHTVTSTMTVSNPCIKYNNPEDIQVTDGSGIDFDNTAYFVSDAGYIYKRAVSSNALSPVLITTSENDRIVGLGTDKYQYIEILTEHTSNPRSEGVSIYDISVIDKDKKYINLADDEAIREVRVLLGLNKNQEKFLKGNKLSRTTSHLKGREV